jgi:hypothetical protein
VGRENVRNDEWNDLGDGVVDFLSGRIKKEKNNRG